MKNSISGRQTKIVHNMIKNLEKLSLLEKNDAIIEGFYPIRINQSRYYGLVTPNLFILVLRGILGNPDQFEIFPLREIEAIEFQKIRVKGFIYSAIMAILYSFISCLIVYLVQISCDNCLVPKVSATLYFLLIMSGAIVVFIGLLSYYIGDYIISLKFSGKNLILRDILVNFIPINRMVFFKIDDQGTVFQNHMGNIKDVYFLFQKYGGVFLLPSD